MEWKISDVPVDYEQAVAFMEARVAAIRAGSEEECIWLLEHPPLFTAGSSANAADLIDSLGFPVYSTGRGGQYTYHGPGQRIIYVMLDLRKREPDIRQFVKKLEQWVIATLAEFGVTGEVRDGRVGVWVETPQGEAKIAALGIRVRGGVSYHGISINVNPNLDHYRGIIPCGISDYGVISLHALGIRATMCEVDEALKNCFKQTFVE